MKNIIKLFLFALIISSFYACPSGLDYPLTEPGKDKIDETLIGVWKNKDTETEIQKIEISKKDDFSYTLKVLEKGELYALDTDNFTGWICSIDDKRFIFFKAENNEQYYHYVIKEIKGKNLFLCDLILPLKSKEAINSTKTLREELINAMKLPDFCGEPEQWIKE